MILLVLPESGELWSLSDSQLCAPLLVPKCPVLLDGSLHPLNYNLTAVVEEGAA